MSAEKSAASVLYSIETSHRNIHFSICETNRSMRNASVCVTHANVSYIFLNIFYTFLWSSLMEPVSICNAQTILTFEKLLKSLIWLSHPRSSVARLPVDDPALPSIITNDHAKDLCASDDIDTIEVLLIAWFRHESLLIVFTKYGWYFIVYFPL